MIEIVEAERVHIEPLIGLESALFMEDAGQHDPHSDPTWPEREGREDFEEFIASSDCILLAAMQSGEAVGLLAGYASDSSPTRQPIRFATLRTMYVVEAARRLGVATLLIDRFVVWATEQGCLEVHVDHYAANEAAGRLYERCGFRPRSVSRVLSL
ncbi:MAG: GNAT family N-acetyltransferase [Acidimicrobiales bacterium]